MKPTISIDTSAFNEVLKRAVEQSSRQATDVINNRLFTVALKAIKFTEKANRDEILRVLSGISAEQNLTLKQSKSGLKEIVSRKLRLGENSFAARIVNARRRDFAGADFMLWGNALEEAAARLIKARIASAGFIKSGWIWSIRAILPYVKFGRRAEPKGEAKLVGRPKGTANPAKMRLFKPIEGSITNTALIASGGKFQAPGAHNPMPVAIAGLRIALADEQAEMERHLREKLMKAMRQAGATVK